MKTLRRSQVSIWRSCVAVCLFAVAGWLLYASSADADYLYPNWDPNPSVPAPMGPPPGYDPISDGQDIFQGGWEAYDSGYIYFRMDLVRGPVAGNYAGLYAIYINAIPGYGANSTDWDFIPNELTGIDYVLYSRFDEIEGWGDVNYFKFFVWDGSDFSFRALEDDEHRQGQQGGNPQYSVEWKINSSEIGGPYFCAWFVTTDIGSAVKTYDMANYCAVPEPSTLVLLGLASLGLLVRRWRN